MGNSVGPVLFDFIKSVRYHFGYKTQFTIGRNKTSCIDILSKVVSRNQCVIELNDKREWYIKDLSKFKTTLVNETPINEICTVLKHGDKISFQHYKGSEFMFENLSEGSNVSKRRVQQPRFFLASIDKDEATKNYDRLKTEYNNLMTEKRCLSIEKDALYEQYMNVCKIFEEKQKSLELLEANKASLEAKLLEEITEKNEMRIHIENYIEELNECKIDFERLSDEIKIREENALEFQEIKENLEGRLEEFTSREEGLNEALMEKEMLLNNISNLLEEEFTCSICSELIYQAVTLKCRHTFCAKCLVTWKLTKKECPICRAKIRSEVNPLILDQFIDKFTDLIGGEFKNRRDTVREERKPRNSRRRRVSPFRIAQTNARGGRRRANTRRNPIAQRPELTDSEDDSF